MGASEAGTDGGCRVPTVSSRSAAGETALGWLEISICLWGLKSKEMRPVYNKRF